MSVSTAPVTIRHRYPWSGEEKGILAAFVGVPAAVAVHRLLTDGGLVLPVVLAVVGWSVAAALVVLGSRRKRASEVTATLTGTRLVVRGGRVTSSRGDLGGAVSASTTRIGPETVLVVRLSEGTVSVPGRIVGDAALSAVLAEHLVRRGADLTPGARELLGV